MSNTRYKTIPRTVEAMQLPEGAGSVDALPVAEWMIENGYEDPDEDPEDFTESELHLGRVLPEWGVNYLVVKDSDSEEHTAHSGDWIVKGVEEWIVMDAVEFSHTFEPAS